MTWTPWTTATLASQVLGVINREPAAGGTAPDRITAAVIQAGVWLWHCHDWRFRRKRGTMHVLDGQSSVVMPADFGELDQYWLRDQQARGDILRFTENVDLWQQIADDYEMVTAAEGEPKVALITRDYDRTHFSHKAVLAPTADAHYEYDYWYLVNDPWTRRAELTTTFTGDNNDLVFVGKAPGYSAVTVAFTNSSSLTVSVVTSAITIQIITGVTTAAQVKVAFDAAATATALAYCDYKNGDTGAGTMAGTVAAAGLGGVIADTDSPQWPQTFFDGWELLATARVQQKYVEGDLWKSAQKAFDAWLDGQKAENDEMIAMANEPIQDGYGDHAATQSAQTQPLMDPRWG